MLRTHKPPSNSPSLPSTEGSSVPDCVEDKTINMLTAGNLVGAAPHIVAPRGVLVRVSPAGPFGAVALLPSRIKTCMIQSCYAPNFDAF